MTVPHCDARVLHAPGECEYCDNCPELQEARRAWGIAFTGHAPNAGERACPADVARPAGSPADHRRWGGNRPTSSYDDPSWPTETPQSYLLYGPPDDRAWTPGFVERVGSSLRSILKGLS